MKDTLTLTARASKEAGLGYLLIGEPHS